MGRKIGRGRPPQDPAAHPLPRARPPTNLPWPGWGGKLGLSTAVLGAAGVRAEGLRERVWEGGEGPLSRGRSLVGAQPARSRQAALLTRSPLLRASGQVALAERGLRGGAARPSLAVGTSVGAGISSGDKHGDATAAPPLGLGGYGVSLGDRGRSPGPGIRAEAWGFLQGTQHNTHTARPRRHRLCHTGWWWW